MPPKSYSERFVRTNVPATVTWTCPAGYRAVVRSVVGVNARNDASGYVVVTVANIRVLQLYPAVNQTINIAMQQVLYGGEAVTLVTSQPNIEAAVSGYLFEDVTMATAAPGDLEVRLLPTTKPVEASSGP